MSKVSIIDYGIGNILSVKRAFENQGAEVVLIKKPEDVLNSERVVLPGVGAFADGMTELYNRNLVEAIQEYCAKNRPFLGICLGMQMMLQESEEFGITKGLGIIPGRVVRIADTDLEGNYQKVPHVGWNELSYTRTVDNTLLKDIPEKSSMYFVHSYTANPESKEYRLADTYYGGRCLAAVINKGNSYGTQFHPEKSGSLGLNIIFNFMRI